ncbi:hypothetical protein AB1Y20_020745 [Prymnesium parvum]
MRLFQKRASHQRLESGDQTHEIGANESAGMQAVVINVMVPAGQKLGCEFNAANYVISVAKNSIAAMKDIREEDLIVQINGVGTDGKSAEEMIATEETLAITLLRKRRATGGRGASEASSWTDGMAMGAQDAVHKDTKLEG